MHTSRLAVLAVVFGLSGCAFGAPAVKPIEPYTPVSTTPSDTSACRLFDPSLLVEPRFKNGYANASDCFWASDDAGSMVVGVRENSTPEQYLGKPDGLKTSPVTIGQHSGLLAENSFGPGTCSVVLTRSGGVTSVRMLTEAGGRACEIAQAVMKVVEPKLS